MTSTALVRVKAMTAVEIFKAGAIDPIIEAIEAEVRAQAAQLDISTETNRKALASLAFKVAKSKTFVESQRKALVADEKKRLAKIDEEGLRIWNRFEALQDEVRKPLTDWENADKERRANHEQALREIEGAGPYSLQNWQALSVEAMRDRLKEIDSERDWEEFAQRAAGARAVAHHQIAQAIAKREQHEAEQAELSRLRAEAAERAIKEREEAAAKAAKEKAEHEAAALAERESRRVEAERQRLENERLQAEARAKQAEAQRIAAEQAANLRAKEAAEKANREKEAAVEAERQRVAALAERERLATEARERNQKHKAKINREAAAALEHNCALLPGVAEVIVAAITSGQIPNVTISY